MVRIASNKHQNFIKRDEIFNLVNDVIFISNSEGIIEYKSHNVERLFQWEPKDLINKNIYDYINPTDKNGVQLLYQSILDKPNSEISVECRFICKNKTYKWINLTCKNLLHNRDVKGILGSYHDISDKKKAEESELFLTDSQKSGKIGSYRLDFELGDWISSETLDTILGIPDAYHKDMKGWFEIIHPDDRENLQTHFHNKIVGNKKVFDKEYRIIRKSDGEVRWVHGMGNPVYNKEEKLIQILGTIQDITTRKLTEEALRESEEKGRLFIENTPLPIAMFDTNMCYLAASKRWWTDYKLGDVQLLGRSHYDVFPEIGDKWKDDHQRVLRGEIYKNDADKFVRQDGSVQWLRYELRPWYKSDHSIGGLVMFTEDITEKVLAEEALLEREQKLLSLFKVVPTGIGVVVDRKIIDLNPKVSEITGYKKEELIGKSSRILYPSDEEFLRVGKIKYTQIDKKGTGEIETVWKRKDGSLVNIYLASTPIDPNDYSKGVTFTALDITQSKRYEVELLHAKEKAEESDRLKTAFLQNMSHEIRTPLNAIYGFSDLLDQQGISTDKQKEYISIVKNSSTQLLSILNNIFTVSSLQTKQEIVKIESFSLNQVIDELSDIFQDQLVKNNLSFKVQKSETDDTSVISTDKTKLLQILTNLIGNAIKFTRDGFIELGYKINDKEIYCYVKDSGIGIHPEQQNIIFERFAQANNSIHIKYGGSGLGLSIAKGYTELLNGKIWLDSKPDKGSTFHFTLPNHTIDDSGSATVPIKNVLDKQLTILLAEDEEINILFIQELLGNENIELIVVNNGRDAVDACMNNKRIDLVLMDIKMPVLDGFSAAKEIKEFNKGIPIVAQTAYALQSEIEKYKTVFDDYITKPIKPNALYNTIYQCLNV